MMKKIMVIIPVYNERVILEELWRRLSETLSNTSYDWRVLFVDDGSTDGTTDWLKEMAKSESRIRVLVLSRNFGHQGALTAGLDHAEGDAVILMDGDLQDRPEAVPEFLAAWEKGSQVVYAVRKTRAESVAMRILFNLFYACLRFLSGIRQPLNAGIFGLLDRRVLDVIRSMPEHNRYFPGLRAFAGFKQTGVPVDRDPRFAGRPRVGFRGLFKLAFDAIFSFSYIPLRLATVFGLCVALGAFVYLAIVFYHRFITHEAIQGWASILGAVLLLGGLQLVMMGIVGEYIGRIYEESKKRPQYIVERQYNIEG